MAKIGEFGGIGVCKRFSFMLFVCVCVTVRCYVDLSPGEIQGDKVFLTKKKKIEVWGWGRLLNHFAITKVGPGGRANLMPCAWAIPAFWQQEQMDRE